MSKRLAWISITIGGLASVGSFLLTSQFFFVARGTSIFPLGWMRQIIFISGFALLFGAGPALYALLIPPRRLAIVGLSLSLLPGPLSLLLFLLASAICGFILGG